MSILWGGICKSFLEVITTKGIYSELQSSTILEEKFTSGQEMATVTRLEIYLFGQSELSLFAKHLTQCVVDGQRILGLSGNMVPRLPR